MRLRTRLALTVLATSVPVVAGTTWARARFEQRTVERGMHDFVLAFMENGGREIVERAPERFPDLPGRRPPWARERDERRGDGPDRIADRGPDGEPAGPDPRELIDRPQPDDGRDLDRPQPAERAAQGDRAGSRAPGADRRAFDDGGRRGDPQRNRNAFEAARRAFGGNMPERPELWAYDASFASSNPRAPAFPAELRAALEKGREYESSAWETDVRGEHRVGIQLAARMPWDEGPAAIVLARRADRGPQSAVIDLLWSSIALCAVVLGAVFFTAGPIVARVRRLTAQVKDSAAGKYATTVDAEGKDEIAELARAFNDAGSEVRANLETVEMRERTLRAFVENTTHDVMLPLTVLQGHLTALRRRVDAGTLPERETVHQALEESHYLSSLLQNLAVAASLEGGEMQIAKHPVDLNALVERAVARQRPIAHQKNVQVEFAVPEAIVRVLGNVTFLEQMLSNVIHNAVRYNRENGHVAVLLEERGEDRELFALRVVDDGPGIPDAMLERVVERSFRTDEARSRVPDGLGLGLSIAKDVAELHGLKLAMRRSAAGGLEVEFTGPRMRPDAPRPSLAPGSTPSEPS